MKGVGAGGGADSGSLPRSAVRSTLGALLRTQAVGRADLDQHVTPSTIQTTSLVPRQRPHPFGAGRADHLPVGILRRSQTGAAGLSAGV